MSKNQEGRIEVEPSEIAVMVESDEKKEDAAPEAKPEEGTSANAEPALEVAEASEEGTSEKTLRNLKSFRREILTYIRDSKSNFPI